MNIPKISHWNPFRIPIFPTFSQHFPNIFPTFSQHFPNIFPTFPYSYPTDLPFLPCPKKGDPGPVALAKLRRGALLDHAHTAAAGLKSAWPQRAQCALGEFLSFADVCNNIWWHFSWEDPWNIYGIMGYIYIIIMKTYIYIFIFI